MGITLNHAVVDKDVPFVLADGDVTTAKIADLAVTAAKIAGGQILPRHYAIHTLVALADASATLTQDNLANNGVMTITPTIARTLTTPTGNAIITTMNGATVGSNFRFTIVNLGNFPVTLAAGADVTLVGATVLRSESATFEGIVGGGNTVVIYNISTATEASPAFRAYNSSNQAITTDVWTKMLWNTELYDYNANFAGSTFTATIAGVHNFSALIDPGASGSINYVAIAFHKNGSQDFQGTTLATVSIQRLAISTDVYLAIGDTYDAYGYIGGVSPSIVGNVVNTFSGHLVRAT